MRQSLVDLDLGAISYDSGGRRSYGVEMGGRVDRILFIDLAALPAKVCNCAVLVLSIIKCIYGIDAKIGA
jgi:hypothetical protein